MNAKVFAMGLMVVAATMAAAGPAPRSVLARQNANANKRAPRPKTGSASKASGSQAAAPAPTEEKPKDKRPARRHPRETVGIPSGAGACVARLEQLASKEPLTPFEKGPEQIINNGLLWNDPHSKCSVGSDQAVRNKVVAVATAWQQKNASGVQSALADLKSSVPAEAPAGPKKPRRRHTAAPKSAAESGAAAEPAANANSGKAGTKARSRKTKSANKNSGA